MAGMTGHRAKPGAVLQVGPAKPNNRPPPPKPKRRYSKKQILEALQASNGLVHVAAKRLGCARYSLVRYFERYPDLKVALEDIRDSRVDVAEHHLMEQIAQNNTTATLFLLRCLGKNRGWVEDPKVQLHAHVTEGSGTWMEIMRRVMERQASDGSEVIDVTPAPNKMLEKGVASCDVQEEDDDE